jgi:hypothetical protein
VALVDPRLTSTLLLAIAALRATERRKADEDRYGVCWLGEDGQPEGDGHSPSGVFLPRKYATAEAWYLSPLVAGMRAKLQVPGGEA